MLTSRNSGKYLSAAVQRDRERCARNSSLFSSSEQARLDISEPMGHGDRWNETCKLPSSPIDPETTEKQNVIDLRKRPECGGVEGW